MYVIMDPYDFNVGDMSDVLLPSLSLTHSSSAAAEPISNHVVPNSPVLLVAGNLAPLSTVKVLVCCWLFEPHPAEIPGLKWPSEVAQVGNLDAYEADVEGGDWDISRLSGGLALCHRSCIHVDYKQLREVCSTVNLSLTSVVYPILLAVCSTPRSQIALLLTHGLAALRRHQRPATSVSACCSRKLHQRM